MKFIDVESLDISLNLDVLNRDTQRYSMFLYQHHGDFYADNLRIENVDQIGAFDKYKMLFKKASDENIALVMSPEYSCPKKTIDSIINKEIQQPRKNKIWVLGGESINKNEIADLMSKNSNEVLIHSENVYESSDKEFLNPLYYIFKGKHEEVDKLIVLIQFKTKHMGGLWSGGEVEADNLIEGESIYVLKNSNTSTRLVSFVCSEAMNVRQKLSQDIKDSLMWSDMPFLVLNLQVNPDPSHLEFVKFRNFILEDNKKEIISLNWGKETKVNNKQYFKVETNTPRSGIFFKTLNSELNHTSIKVVENHEKGFYFLYQNRDKFVYLLNGYVELIFIENKPVDINQGVPQQRRREGPEAKKNYKYDFNKKDFIEINDIDDSYIDFFKERGIEVEYLLSEENSIVDKERLINISTGQVSGNYGRKWCDVIHLKSFELKETDECNCRMTYVEDSYPTSEAVRTLNCTNLIELDQNILTDDLLYPDSIKDISYKNIILSYSKNSATFNYKYNLTDENGELIKATICNIGNARSIVVNKAYDELQKLFENGTDGKSRVVVFYKRGVEVLSKYDLNAGSIIVQPNDHSSIL